MLEIAKILELLETTSDSKLNTAKREYAPVKVSATESANDMLNKELGMDKEAPAKEPSKVPSKFLNKKRVVEEIGNNDFNIEDGVLIKYNGTSKEVVIPNSVTEISDDAFANNNLTSVTIPNSVTRIGDYAFARNNLTSVTIPNRVTEISDGAFMNNNLTSVTIPNRVTKIGDNAFYKNQLTSVTIPNSVTKIGQEAFFGNNLTSVKIPNNLASADRDAFDDGVKIIWEGANKRADEEFNNNDFEIKDGVLVKYNGTSKHVVIPNSVTIIGDGAFSGTNLSKVTIPNSATEIGIEAFADNYLTNVIIPDSVTEIGSSAFARNNLTNVKIPNSVTIIGGAAFADNYLTSIDIPNSVTEIGEFAFASNNLTNVIIPDSVTIIGEDAFARNNLTSVKIPNSVTIIDDYAFEDNNLSSVTIPNSATKIGYGAFDENVKIIKEGANKRADEDIELGTPAEGAFPESLIFDEEAFSDEYGIEVETISAAYVAESEDGQIPEHLEISFEFEGSNIVLSVMADGAVEETVDGEFIEPAQFSGEIGERENEDGTVDQVLTLTLLDEESEDEESVKSEEDELTKSEGDEDHTDEEGSQITEEELIEQRGLEEDEYYATSHDMNVSKNPANRMDSRLGTSRPERSVGESRKGTGKRITSARESLAAKTNRKYKR